MLVIWEASCHENRKTRVIFFLTDHWFECYDMIHTIKFHRSRCVLFLLYNLTRNCTFNWIAIWQQCHLSALKYRRHHEFTRLTSISCDTILTTGHLNTQFHTNCWAIWLNAFCQPWCHILIIKQNPFIYCAIYSCMICDIYRPEILMNIYSIYSLLFSIGHSRVRVCIEGTTKTTSKTF